jgi:hypothetical protein
VPRLQAIIFALGAIHLAFRVGVQGGIDMNLKDWQELITIHEAAD